MSVTTGMFSSNSDEWETPSDLFRKLDGRYHFTLDAASTHENAKCARHFTAEENGLLMPWGGSGCFATRPMAGRYASGSESARRRPGRSSRCSYRPALTRRTFTTTSTASRMCASSSCADGSGSSKEGSRLAQHRSPRCSSTSTRDYLGRNHERLGITERMQGLRALPRSLHAQLLV